MINNQFKIRYLYVMAASTLVTLFSHMQAASSNYEFDKISTQKENCIRISCYSNQIKYKSGEVSKGKIVPFWEICPLTKKIKNLYTGHEFYADGPNDKISLGSFFVEGNKSYTPNEKRLMAAKNINPTEVFMQDCRSN